MTCELTTEEYRNRLAALLPPGPAFTATPESTLAMLLSGLAAEFSAAHNRACTLTREVNPISTVEMLPDWEAVVGRDACLPDGATTAERRAAVLAKLAATGGQSPGYFRRLAATIGYEVDIIEHRPFRAGRSAAGDALTNDGDGDATAVHAWTHWWTVEAPLGSVVYFRAGLGSAGEPLARFGDDLLECLINQYKPAHTGVIFNYV